MAKTCHCGLVNPDSASRCDCGSMLLPMAAPVGDRGMIPRPVVQAPRAQVVTRAPSYDEDDYEDDVPAPAVIYVQVPPPRSGLGWLRWVAAVPICLVGLAMHGLDSRDLSAGLLVFLVGAAIVVVPMFRRR